MSLFYRIAEQRIRDAVEQGEFESLPNAGQPLDLEDETWIPEDLRMVYRMLKNAGFVPPELELHNEILSMRRMINSLDDNAERTRKVRELNFKLLKLEEMTGRRFQWERFPEYEDSFYRKLIPD